MKKVDHQGIDEAILDIASQRGVSKSTCPSEIARALFPKDWRNHMEEVRDHAIRLQKEGKVVITQKSRLVDLNAIKGPIRITIKS